MFGLNWIVIASFGSLLLLLGVEEIRISSLKTEHAEYVFSVEKSARLASEQALAEISRRQAAFDQEAEHARTEIKELEATVSALADTSDSLRDTVAKYQRTRSSACTTIGSKSQPSDAPRDLLAELYLGLVKAAKDTSGYAERVYIAGDTCERAADKAR